MVGFWLAKNFVTSDLLSWRHDYLILVLLEQSLHSAMNNKGSLGFEICWIMLCALLNGLSYIKMCNIGLGGHKSLPYTTQHEGGEGGDCGWPKSFRFEWMWVYMPHSFDIFRESWNVTMTGSPTHILAMKSKNTKEALLHWNRDEVGNIFQRDKLLQSRIESLKLRTQIVVSPGRKRHFYIQQNRSCVMFCGFKSLCGGKSFACPNLKRVTLTLVSYIVPLLLDGPRIL